MDKIKLMLKDVGLTDKESAVYVALLSCGQASAYTVADKSGLKPPTAYLTLQSLIRKGLAYTLPKAKKKLFVAKDPREVVDSLEEKVSRTRRALPDMLALIPSDIPKISIRYYQGMKGLQEAFEYGFKQGHKTKETVGFFATGENISQEYMRLSEKYLNELHKNKILLRGITPNHSSIMEINKLGRDLGNNVRMVPYDEYSAKASIEASDTFVRIILNDEQKSIIVENAELAKMFKQIFEMVWKK